MEILQEKEKRIFDLVKDSSNDDEAISSVKAKVLVQEVISTHQIQRDSIRQEIERVENVNKLCNLNLQMKIIEEARRKNQQVYKSVLSELITHALVDWTKLAENLKNEIENTKNTGIDIIKIFELVSKLTGTIAENLYSAEPNNWKNILFGKILPFILNGVSVNESNIAEGNDIEVEEIERSAVTAQENPNTKDNLSDLFIKLLSFNEAKLRDMSSNFLNIEGNTDIKYTYLNTAYLTLPISQFEEIYHEFKARIMQTITGNLSDTYTDFSSYFSYFEKILPDIQTDFIEECNKITFSHDYFLTHITGLLQKVYFPFLKTLLGKWPVELSSQDLTKLMQTFSTFFEGLLSNIYDYLEPDNKEELRIKTVFETNLDQYNQILYSHIVLFFENKAREYIEESSFRLENYAQLKVKYQDTNKKVQSNNSLRNIRLDSKVMTFLEDYNIAENIVGTVDEEDGSNTNKHEMSFSKVLSENTDEKNLLFLKNQNTEEDKSPKPNIFVPETTAVPFLKLTYYNVSNSLLLTEEIKRLGFLTKLLNSKALSFIEEIEGVKSLNSFIPSRISSSLLKFWDKVSPCFEYFVRLQARFAVEKNFVIPAIKSLLSFADNIQEKIQSYLELQNPDGLLYFCDWLFLNYRINQILNVTSVITPNQGTYFRDDIKRRFINNTNYNLNQLQKNYMVVFNMFVQPAIDNEDWRSFRPFISSEAKEDLMREKINNLGAVPVGPNTNYIKNVNYGVRMWKTNLKSHIDELSFYLDSESNDLNLCRLRLIVNLVLETTTAIYFKYKAIEPSRMRNPQYLNDLRYTFDNSLFYMKVVFGMMLIQLSREESNQRQVFNSEKLFLVGSLDSLWWNIKSIKSQIALMDANYHVLASFLQDCVSSKTDLVLPDEKVYSLLNSTFVHLQNEARSIAEDKFDKEIKPAQVLDNNKFEIRDNDNNKIQEDLIFQNAQEKLQIILEKLALLAEYTNLTSLSKLYESFDQMMESVAKLTLYNPSDRHIREKIKLLGLENVQSQKKTTSENISLEGEISKLLKPIKNPLLKYSQNLFLNETLNDWPIPQILTNLVITPKNLLSTIKKRIEYTFDDYPLLTEENKDAQKVLNPILKEFCLKFDLKIFDVPAS